MSCSATESEESVQGGQELGETYLDIEEILGEHGWTMIDWGSLTIELATKHLSGDGHAEHITSELAMSVGVVDVGGSFENLCKGKMLKSASTNKD